MIRSYPWILAGLLLAGSAHAQPAQVQAIRPSMAEDLNSHLARLASNPRDVNALIGAGEAALAMDDTHAAAGFFARADAIQGNNGRVKAGLGRIMLKSQNGAEALRLFDQAKRFGFPEATILSDRGLAHDMMGDQAAAQRDYQAALRRTPDDAELIRRYAASLGISGQVDAAEKTLDPLLYKSDRAAWRYRAFIFAMNNRQSEARKVAQQTMPGPLASAIIPYMEKMPYLTAAQKAAAVHFGHFPANVGTKMAAITPTPSATPQGTPATVAPPVASAPVKPAGRSASSRATIARRAVPQPSQPAAATPPPAAPVPAPSIASRPNPVQGPPAPGSESPPTTPPARPSAPSQLNAISLAQAAMPAPSVPQPVPSTPAPQAPASPAAPPAAPPPVAAASPVPTVARSQPDPEATRTLADIIRAIDVPESERQPSVAAVDLAEIQAMQAARRAERQAAADKVKKAAAAKAKAEADAKAKKEAEEKARLAANPSRNWLQIGTGQDRGALGFTLKAMRKKYDPLAAQDGWTAGWGRTNRLLVGPFASFTRAKTLEADLKKAGADVFAWKSEAGEVVERIGAK